MYFGVPAAGFRTGIEAGKRGVPVEVVGGMRRKYSKMIPTLCFLMHAKAYSRSMPKIENISGIAIGKILAEQLTVMWGSAQAE